MLPQYEGWECLGVTSYFHEDDKGRKHEYYRLNYKTDNIKYPKAMRLVGCDWTGHKSPPDSVHKTIYQLMGFNRVLDKYC